MRSVQRAAGVGLFVLPLTFVLSGCDGTPVDPGPESTNPELAPQFSLVDPVIFDQGPGTGARQTYGLTSEWLDRSHVDRFHFNADMLVTGINIFAQSSRLWATDQWHLWIRADNNGWPSTVLYEETGPVESWTNCCGYAWAWQFSYPLATTFEAEAGAYYWIGLAPIGFSVGQYYIKTPTDGVLDSYQGLNLFLHNWAGGDMMFQLVGSAAANTPAGNDVPVVPVDETTGDTPVTVTFSEVITPGNTTLATADNGPPPPTGFRLGTPAVYYEISTDASFAPPIEVCISYSGINHNKEKRLKLLHMEGGSWVDRTSSHDMVNDVICASVTSFSQFVIAETQFPPTVGPISVLPNALVPVGTQVDVTATFTDPDVGDTHTAEIDWGDQTSSPATVTGTTVSGGHPYTEAGIYSVEVTVTDEEGAVGAAEYRYVVVYDPSGGFVTGGGWIDSPEEAFAGDPLLTGKATFGFVAKYKKGANVPDGNTEFQFKAGDLNFHSTSYDFLVVTGSDFARFKGTGTINGTGEYKFMIWGGDGDPDTFRIRIWEEIGGVEVVIYDNGMNQPIGGGSIVVHTGKK